MPLDPHAAHLIALRESDDARARDAAMTALLEELGTTWGKWSRHLGQDEARQEAAIAVLKAACRYDPSRRAIPFLVVVMRRHFATLYTLAHAECRSLPEGTKLNPPDEDREAFDRDPPILDGIILRDEAARLRRDLIAILSPREYEAVVYSALKIKPREIGLKGTGIKSLDNARERAKAKLDAAPWLTRKAAADGR